MYVEILSCISDYPHPTCRFESTILNLDNISSIKLRKSSASDFLKPNCFPAIEYNCGGRDYYELFQSDDIALNRYNEIITSLNKEGFYRGGMRVSQRIIYMDESHKNEPFRNCLRWFCNADINQLDKSIESHNQQILNGNIKKEETISEWLDHFLDARKKAREAEQTKEG